jgi:tetratricopeptide (TPR) repeat protein
MEQGQLEKAEDAFKSLIEKDQDYLPAYYFLGETKGRRNDMPDAHYYLGIYYYKKGEYRTARHHLEKARQMLQDPVKLESVKQALESMGPPSKVDQAN